MEGTAYHLPQHSSTITLPLTQQKWLGSVSPNRESSQANQICYGPPYGSWVLPAPSSQHGNGWKIKVKLWSNKPHQRKYGHTTGTPGCCRTLKCIRENPDLFCDGSNWFTIFIVSDWWHSSHFCLLQRLHGFCQDYSWKYTRWTPKGTDRPPKKCNKFLLCCCLQSVYNVIHFVQILGWLVGTFTGIEAWPYWSCSISTWKRSINDCI